ncbi:MAG: type I glutamate--ammonia ligase [Proteobacteria bacterium]|nr:type I glutamate--ammonia ligase [Pseudomonadota bacterium]
MSAKILKLIKDQKIRFLDYRFTDTHGVCHHVTTPIGAKPAELLQEYKSFDGSSLPGWRGIEDSDMQLAPDFSSAVVDPFLDEPTLAVFCDVLLPNGKPYDLCPRSIANNTLTYLKKTGIGSDALFGPEAEFFVFDSIQWKNEMQDTSFTIHSEEGAWSSANAYDGFNSGHRPQIKGGYFPLPPVDSLADMRNEMCIKLAEMGVEAEVHHHEVGTGGQCEIGTRCGSLVERGDHNQIFKYVVRNVAHQFGKTATFMPKPLRDDNGSGMHVHQSISKNGKNIFRGNLYAGLSQEALWYIGGVLKHARALNAITNPATNSYKRLMPGFEAPVKISYSARNRSALVRIPVSNDKARRVELRFPDPMANSYLCFAAMLVAGLDGIKNKIDPGEPADYNLYANRRRGVDKNVVKEVCGSLSEALNALDSGRDFLIKSGVFSNEMIDSYLTLKWEEVHTLRRTPQPIEFEQYYSR